MKNFVLIIFICGSVIRASALEKSERLEQKLIDTSSAYRAQVQTIQAKELSYRTRFSLFAPSVSLNGGWEYSKTDALSTPEKGTVAFVESKWNLFNGLQDSAVADQLHAELARARIEAEATKQELLIRLTEVISSMIYLHKLEDILSEEMEVVKVQRAMAARKVASGLTGPVDNLEFDLRENELEVERNEIQRQHRQNHLKIIELFGEDISDSELEKIEYSDVKELSSKISDFRIEQNLSYRKAEAEKELRDGERRQLRGRLLPTLDAFYAIGRLTPSETDSFRYNESKYGILLTWPIFSGLGDYNRMRAGSAAVEVSESLKLQTAQAVQAEFNTLKDQLRAYAELYEINEKKISNSKKYFDLTLQEYKRGIKNSPDLVTATERFFAARKKKYEILRELEHGRAQLRSLQ